MIPFEHLSYWEKTHLFKDLDSLIIGSGITGLSTAIHLKMDNPNQKVLVLERSYLPCGASTKNAGFACIGSPGEILDDLSKEDEAVVFNRLAKRYEGLKYLRKLLGDYAIDFQKLGSYELFNSSEEAYDSCMNSLCYLNQKVEEYTSIANCFTAYSSLSTFGFKHFDKAIHHKAEGQIDTGKMMFSLLKKAQELGVMILNGIEIKEIGKNQLESNWGKIPFKKLAICTNGLTQKLLSSEKISPARAQVIISKPIKNLKFKGIFHFDQGYYYFRNVGNRVLFGGGRNLNFKKEETDSLDTSEEIINHLKEIMKSRLLPNQDFEIEDSWAGTMGIGQSKEVSLKEIKPGVFCCVGLGGMGVALGSLLGKELTELMNQNNF